MLIATAEGTKKKRSLFRRKTKQSQSIDDSSLETLDCVGQDSLRRQISDTNLASEFLTIPEKEKSKSRISIRDKFTDMSKSLRYLYINLRRSNDCRLIWLVHGCVVLWLYSHLRASFAYFGQLLHCT